MCAANTCVLLLILAGLCNMCTGLPVLDGSSARGTRTRFPRQAGSPCPYGMSRETCFYSQLNMFMKIHDSMMDPVSLRNIGKRNGDQNMASMTSSTLREQPFTDDIIPSYRDYNVISPESLESESSKELILEELKKVIRNLDERDRVMLMSLLREFEKRFYDDTNLKRFSNNGGEEMLSKRSSSPMIPSQSKRHIICPASMSRVQCYDQALAFYMRLMRSVGKQ